MSRYRGLGFGLPLLLWSSLAFAQAPRYTVEGLGTFGAAALNDHKAVAGTQNSQAVLVHGQTVTPLGFLSGGQYTVAASLSGEHVVGYGLTGPVSTQHAFLYTPQRGMQDIGLQWGATLSSAATGINGAHAIAGYAALPAQPTRALLQVGGHVLDLGTLGGDGAAALGLNEHGDVTGEAQLPDQGVYHAALWPVDGPVRDLDTLGSPFSMGLAVNIAREVVGTVTAPGVGQRGFRWTEETGMVLLPPLPGDNRSAAGGLNEAGLAVGFSSKPAPGGFETLSQAVLFVEGIPVALTAQLDTPGWVLFFAVAINEDGRIVAQGTYQGQPQVALLTPVPDRVAARQARKAAQELEQAEKAAEKGHRMAGR